jgi:hypothetical protein
MDFVNTCRDHGLPIHTNNPEVVWIDHVQQFFGKKIYNDDKIIKGEQYHVFDMRMQDAIDMEITLRTEQKKRGRK